MSKASFLNYLLGFGGGIVGLKWSRNAQTGQNSSCGARLVPQVRQMRVS
jgi:hypothetical protein